MQVRGRDSLGAICSHTAIIAQKIILIQREVAQWVPDVYKRQGKEEETSKYENGNLKELVTGGNGTYTYDYDENHNLKSVTNDYVKDTLTHDSMGNTLTSTMESAKTSAGKIVSSSTYTNGGNLLSKVTQRGNTTSYGYSSAFNKMTGLKSDVTDPSGVKASYTYDACLLYTSRCV